VIDELLYCPLITARESTAEYLVLFCTARPAGRFKFKFNDGACHVTNLRVTAEGARVKAA
jgi:hypothetical protein